jgi:hypothetical protein
MSSPLLCLLLACSPDGFGDGSLQDPEAPVVATDSGSEPGTDDPQDSAPPLDTGDTGGVPDDTDSDEPEPEPDPEPEDPCAGLTAGLCWVRSHPMVISGLVPTMGDPDVAAVDTYYDTFGANTTHLWATGLPDEIAAWSSVRGSDHQWIAWLLDDGTSATNGAVIGGLGPNPAGRVGYQIGDEPHDMADLLALQEGIDAVRAADPDALVIVNFGNTDTWAELEEMVVHFATEMGGDVISYDYYGYHYNTYQRLETHRRIALDHGLPYWRYLKSYADRGDASGWPEATDMRWDAFKGALYGFTGHHWFVYQVGDIHAVETTLFSESGSWSANRASGFDTAAQLNEELAILGRSLTRLTSTDVRFTPSVDLYAPDATTPWSPGAGGDPYITSVAPVDLAWYEYQDVLIGFFEDDDGEQYVMLQNPTHASADWPLMVEDEATFRMELDFTGAPASLDQSQLQVLDKTSGAVDGWPLTAIGGARAALEITLAAGDVVFFKYDTGADFVQ